MAAAGDRLTHIGGDGAARMVDIAAKEVSERTAVAEGRVVMAAATLAMILEGNARKGDVVGTARLAGIMAAKRTADLIPLCHPRALAGIGIDIEPDPDLPGLTVRASARVNGRTGVEMEALTAVSVAALTVYDMAKAIDRSMRIGEVRLVHKAGGKSGEFRDK